MLLRLVWPVSRWAPMLGLMPHWVLDVVSHAQGMQLWPHSSIEPGYGQFVGGLGGRLEAAVSTAGLLAYIHYARRPDVQPRRWGVVAGVIAICFELEVLVVP